MAWTQLHIIFGFISYYQSVEHSQNNIVKCIGPGIIPEIKKVTATAVYGRAESHFISSYIHQFNFQMFLILVYFILFK